MPFAPTTGIAILPAPHAPGRFGFGLVQTLTTACVTALFLAVLAAAPALAQSRPIPDDAKRGVMSHVQDMLVSIDGTTMRLAPGANIRDRNNFIIVPTALPAGGALADYTLDANGQVFRAWLLTEEEATRPKKKPPGQ